MSREHQVSLRAQLIEAMTQRLGSGVAESVFQNDLWPVLDKAMDAGELLVARNTVKQLPVHQGITQWLEVVGWTIQHIRNEEHVVSKATLLKVLYQLDESCKTALSDAKLVSGS